jgi:acyl carrier protein
MPNKLQEIVRRYTAYEDFVLTADMVLRTDLGINSYEFVQIVCEVEDAFGVEIPDRAIGGFKAVWDVIAWIEAHG